MKKTVSLLLTVYMLLTAVFAFSSCGHTHSFGEAWLKNDTHHWHACSGCEVIADNAAHTFGEWDCISSTQHARYCVCGAEELENHTFGEGVITTEPTPDTDGVETFTCTACGETKEMPIAYDHEHSYGDWEPISDTQHKKVCECEAEVVANHVWDSGTVTVPATPDEDGTRLYTCTECGRTREESIAYQYILNPYDDVSWTAITQVKSMSHMHVITQAYFDSAVADGYKHFAISSYMPSEPMYDLDEYFTNIPNDIISSPNSEKAFFTNSLAHFNALGSFAKGYGNVWSEAEHKWVPCEATVPWQTGFDEVFAELQFADGGGITLNHPGHPGNIGADKYIEMLDYDDRVLGIEIYNDGMYNSYGVGFEPYVELWDYILSTGRRCFGFAVVDWQGGREWGSNILLVPAFTEHDCLKAYRDGQFYSQLKDTGLRFNRIEHTDGVISVEVNRECTIKFITEDGTVKTVTGTEASYTVSDNTYVRVEAMEEGVEGSHIFSNPFMFKTREEVAAEHDGTLELDNGTNVWNVISGGTLGELTTTVAWEKDGAFTVTEPTDKTGYTKYTIEWYSFGNAGPNLDGSSYVISKKLEIKSIRKNDSADEATITWNGKTYAKGDTVYRSGAEYWLGLSDFMGWAAPSTVFAPLPAISPIAENGEIAIFEAKIKVDIGDYHNNGEYFVLENFAALVVREGATNKLTSGFTVSGGAENYLDVRRFGDGSYYTATADGRAKVGEEFKLRIEIFEKEDEIYEVKTLLNDILIDTCEVPAFNVSNVKLENISSQVRDVTISFSEVKFLKYVESYDAHTHTYEDAWSGDTELHWHNSTCNSHAGCPFARADVGAHTDTDENGRCDVCSKTLAGTITVENPHGLTHTIPTEPIDSGDTVTFTVSVSAPNGVYVSGAVQVGEPTLDGTTKTYTFRIDAIDLSVPVRIERVKEGVTNKVDYSALDTSADTLTTTYLNVSGDTVTEGTLTSHDYVIVWHSNQVSGPALDGTSFTFGRSVAIESVKAFGTDAETSFAVGGVTYEKGSIIAKGALLGTAMWGGGEPLEITSANTVTAPVADPTLRLVLDTDMVVNEGTAGGNQPISILYTAFVGTDCTSTNGHDQIIRIGSEVYYYFGSTYYMLGRVGERFNLRVEIRELETTLTEDPNKAGTAYRPVEIKLIVNGTLVAMREDQVDAGSGNYDTMPNTVRFGCFSDTRDVSITLTDTYFDLYTE